MKVSLDHPPVPPISLWVNAASRSRYYYCAIVQSGRQNSDTGSSARLNASYVHQSGRKLLAGGPLDSVLAVHLDMLFVSDVRMKFRESGFARQLLHHTVCHQHRAYRALVWSCDRDPCMLSLPGRVFFCAPR